MKKANKTAFHFWLMLNVEILNGCLIVFFFLSLSFVVNELKQSNYM